MQKNTVATLFLFLSAIILFSQSKTSAIYTDGHGGYVYFPNGKTSFADVLVSQTNGDPMPITNGGPNTIVLAEPNYDIENSKGFFTLGCGGSITVRFTDNAIMDIEGPDLYIFEVGTFVEATLLEISKDGLIWINVGEINGGRAEVDIKNYVSPGDVFYYLRLTDLKNGCKGYWAGADIDAIGAIGSVRQINLNSSLLFDIASYTLKKEALVEIDNLAKQLNTTSIKKIEILGYTDSIGLNEYNLTLSKNRATSVKEYLTKKLSDKNIQILTLGMGKKQPIANNDTEEGRQQNRRVSLIIYPKLVEKLDKNNYEEFTNVLYLVFDLKNDKWKNGYPKPINKKNFNGINCNHIDDILNYNGKTYFFNESKLKIFNYITNTVEGEEKSIKDIFKGVGFNRIDASCFMPEENVICLIKDDSCLLYNPNNKIIKTVLLQTIFPGLQITNPTAMMNWGKGDYLFFFDGKIQQYNYYSQAPAHPPLLLTEATGKHPWLVGSNLWPTGPDAILLDDKGMIHFLKNPEK